MMYFMADTALDHATNAQCHRVGVLSYVAGIGRTTTRQEIPVAVLVDLRAPHIYGVGFQARSEADYAAEEVRAIAPALRKFVLSPERKLQDLIQKLGDAEDAHGFAALVNAHPFSLRFEIVREKTARLPLPYHMWSEASRFRWASKRIAKKLEDQFSKLTEQHKQAGSPAMGDFQIENGEHRRVYRDPVRHREMKLVDHRRVA